MQKIIEKLPFIVLVILMAISIIICGVFYAGGTEPVECTSGSIDAPIGTDAMINWMYVLLVITTIVTIAFAILSFAIKFAQGPKAIIVPTIAIVGLAIMLIATYFGADTTPINIVGYEGSQEPWTYRLTNMCMVSSAILGVIATIVTLFGFLLKRIN